MKAVIMAGGKGTRLRPICEAMPKPMTKLLGRPLLEHLTELLKSCGFTELCVTLGHKPECITDYFGNGEAFGVSMQYRIESEPLGTAGGVRSCMDFVGGEDFLVISGDAACDFDLRRLAREHSACGAMVTMALYPHPEPLPYGTVLTDKDRRVISFIEKPNWERVVTDLVNTGVYMISPAAMELVPENTPFDFARDLFPRLVEKGCKIVGIPTEGYWCDIGDSKSYLRCCMDALEGRLRIKMNMQMSAEAGIFASPEILERAKLIPPCMICEGAEIERGAEISRSIIHSASRVGAGSKISSSVIDDAVIGKSCIIDGTVVCSGARLLSKTITVPGSVIAPAGSGAQSSPSKSSLSGRRALGLCREFACDNRARLMRELSCALWEAGADFTDGLTVSDGKCRVRIAPLADVSAISIEAIGGRESERLALCKKYSALAEQFGGRAK
ncbi:MAG: NDP-sugar synthase [Oscillospiraceae bacterium]